MLNFHCFVQLKNIYKSETVKLKVTEKNVYKTKCMDRKSPNT